ncbi:MAG TPA: type IV pilin [Candidatus Thermoplasmatota archaeon]
MAFRARRSGVSATVGTILMVAITVLLAGVVYLLVSGTLGPPPPTPPSIAFSSGGWVGGNYSAAIVTAAGVTAVPADGLTYIVRDTDQAAYLVGPAGAPVTTSGVTVTVFYVDHDNDNRITGGDTIRIEVDPEAASAVFDGGTFELHHSNRQLALHAL